MYLDRKQKLLHHQREWSGTIYHTPLYPREIAKRCMDLGASSILLAHNHPSGDPNPSRKDIIATQELKRTLAAIDVIVDDHIIVGGSENISFRKMGHLYEEKAEFQYDDTVTSLKPECTGVISNHSLRNFGVI